MRNKNKAFLSCAIVATALLAAAGAMATGSYGSPASQTAAPLAPPTSCTAGNYKVTVTRGPVFVTSDDQILCTDNPTNPGGQCTEIEYVVTPLSGSYLPDHVATLEGVGVQYALGGKTNGNKFYNPCEGDPLTDLGEFSCHQQAAKFNPIPLAQKFTIGLAGQRKPSPTSVVVKKGSSTKACTILGVGLEGVASPFAAASTIERVDFEGCAVDFYKSATGDVVSAKLVTPHSATCGSPNMIDAVTLEAKPISKLTLILDGVPLGDGQIGEGYVSSGQHSCTTRIIGGRVYTWGDPCP